MWFTDLVEFILKLAAKIILIPIFLIAFTVQIFVNILMGIGQFGIGLAYLILLAEMIYSAYMHLWSMFLFLGAIAVATTIVTVGAVAIVMLLESATQAMLSFITEW